MREQASRSRRALWRSAARARRRFGGYVVHLGVVLVFVAIAASQSYVVHTTATLKPGRAVAASDHYTVQLPGLRTGTEPHRRWIAADVDAVDRRRRPAARRSRRG